MTELRYRVPESFRDADATLLSPELLAQIKVSVLLGYGVALPLLGIGGLASLAAVVVGLEARRRVGRSGRRLVGDGLALWRIIFGVYRAAAVPLGVVPPIFFRW